MNEATIEKIISETLEAYPVNVIYSEAMKHVDFEAMKEDPNVTEADLLASFATAGFIVGMRYTLSNYERVEDGE